jgi:Concanavalin A-like lectin/glucanases superfamily
MSATILTIGPGSTIGPGVTLTVPVAPPPPPPPLKSLSFNGTQNTYLDILGTTTDWALGQHGTIEWWQKGIDSTVPAPYGTFIGGIISQGGGGGQNNSIDIFQANGLSIGLGGNNAQWDEPPAGVWSHVAITITPAGGGGIHHLYINGVEELMQKSGYRDTNCINGTDILHVGCRIPGVNYQNWTGLLNNLHINNTTLYTGNFTPTVRTAPIAGTVLLLDSTNPLVDLSASAHTTSGNATVVTDGPI